jgi:hypothetical protein
MGVEVFDNEGNPTGFWRISESATLKALELL